MNQRFQKMHIKYLYIDDEQFDAIHPLVNEIEHFATGNMSIEHIRVCSMKDVTKKFIDESFDGLIIDQKLDAANDHGETVDYWGTALAQNLRTEMIGRGIPTSPIILMSNEDVFVDYYDADESAHNLFDFTVKKGRVAEDVNYACKVSKIIYDLAEAYKIAREQVLPIIDTADYKIYDLLNPLLQWDQSIFKYTDKRFIDCAISKSKDIHALISLILNNLVRSAGILVSEDMLATKLGIDINASADWNNLLEHFNQCRYQGIFSKLKPRWWMSKVEDLWYERCTLNQSLRAFTAQERVEELKSIFALEQLVAITPKYTKGIQSERFWVNCVVTGTPLDPADALVANKSDIKSWEQPLYLDPETVINRDHLPKYPVHPDYQSKVKVLFKRLSNNG